jgi:hypothetical protein
MQNQMSNYFIKLQLLIVGVSIKFANDIGQQNLPATPFYAINNPAVCWHKAD